EPGQFWKDFIRDTASVFRGSTLEQLGGFIAPTWQALAGGAPYLDARPAQVFAQLAPPAGVGGKGCAVPAVPARGRPWVRIVSCNALELDDPALPPRFSGLPLEDRSGWDAFRAEYARQVGGVQAAFSEFCAERGAPPLPGLEMIHESPWLNLTIS